jgi:hypothetical protein
MNTIHSPTHAPDKALQSIRRQQHLMRWLTGLALVLWLAAITACAGIVGGYFVFYLPKQKQILRDYAMPHSPENAGREPMSAEKAVQIHMTLTHVMGMTTIVVAGSVGVLSAGTLVTLLLVGLNRRVTLQQINHSLAQISEQLRPLQAKSDGG